MTRRFHVVAAARSVAIVMEDPDAAKPKPFVHWLLYNLPASITALPEALPSTPRLPQFDGARRCRRRLIGTFKAPHSEPK